MADGTTREYRHETIAQKLCGSSQGDVEDGIPRTRAGRHLPPITFCAPRAVSSSSWPEAWEGLSNHVLTKSSRTIYATDITIKQILLQY
jgi:hypothetical protein